jgi:hypothetical protein
LSLEEILMSIEHLDNEERKKALMIIYDKYNLTDKLPEDSFVVGSSYNFWLCPEDEVYETI